MGHKVIVITIFECSQQRTSLKSEVQLVSEFRVPHCTNKHPLTEIKLEKQGAEADKVIAATLKNS